jgi:hypothetical protein
MKSPRAALLLLLPSAAAAWPAPVLPEVRLESTPFTLVGNALAGLPKVMDGFGSPPPPVPARMVSRMPILAPQSDLDPKMVHGIDPAVDYKLTIVDPELGDGK